MQKIWVDKNLLEYMTIEKTKVKDNKCLITIKFDDVSCLLFSSNMHTVATTNYLYIHIDLNDIIKLTLTRNETEHINTFGVMILDRDIYIMDATELITNNVGFSEKSRCIAISCSSLEKVKDEYDILPLFDENDIVES